LVYTKVVALNMIYNSVVDNFFIEIIKRTEFFVLTWQAHFGKGPKTGLPLSGRDVDVLKIRNIRREM